MFLAYCTQSGCVVLKSSLDPAVFLNLREDWEDHYSIAQFEDKPYMTDGSILTVLPDMSIQVEPYSEELAQTHCQDCPPLLT